MNTPAKNPVGRPTLYNEELCNIVLERLVQGESLEDVCQDPSLPSETSIYLWRHKHKEFAEAYARAREAQTEAFAEKIIKIAERPKADNVEVQADRLRIETHWKLMQARNSRSFGDKSTQQVNVDITNLYTQDDMQILERYANKLANSPKLIENDLKE